MTDSRNGRRIPVPHSRRLSWDLLTFHKSIPLCAHDRLMSLSTISVARESCPVRISWPVLFIKAFAVTAAGVPELRQTWYRWPWAHLYQHPCSVASVTVHRMVAAEPWLFWGQITAPESLPLDELQRRISHFQAGDPSVVFRRQYQLAQLPTLLRRVLWWWNLNVATVSRAKRLGTFFLSTLAGRGTEIQLPPSIQTCCLTYGPLDAAGCCRVTLAYDHRVMDGVLIADCLARIEQILNEDLVAELAGLNS